MCKGWVPVDLAHINTRLIQYLKYTGLIKTMLTLIDYVISPIPHEMCVRALYGTVACWLLFVKHDGEQVEAVL
jgi:hypothetical protein